MSEKYSPGDLVCLKSGSPSMTIKDDTGGGGYVCQWFVGAKLQNGYFEAASLELVPTEE